MSLIALNSFYTLAIVYVFLLIFRFYYEIRSLQVEIKSLGNPFSLRNVGNMSKLKRVQRKFYAMIVLALLLQVAYIVLLKLNN